MHDLCSALLAAVGRVINLAAGDEYAHLHERAGSGALGPQGATWIAVAASQPAALGGQAGRVTRAAPKMHAGSFELMGRSRRALRSGIRTTKARIRVIGDTVTKATTWDLAAPDVERLGEPPHEAIRHQWRCQFRGGL